MDIRDRAVLITGAKRIGATLAEELAARGADVAISYHQSEAEATRTVEAVRAAGRRALAVRADLREPAASETLVDRVADTFGRLDIVIAMASVYAQTPFDALDARQWADALAVDLSASYHTAMAAVPHLRRRHEGRILLIADSEAASGRPRHKGFLPYFVAKSGVIALGRALALELAADGILVNTLACGPILASDGAPAEECEETARATPLGRWGGAAEVAKAIVSLIESDYITGEVIRVDGGRHLA